MRMRQVLAGLLLRAILSPAASLRRERRRAGIGGTHALCIDPIGAPVDPPPAAELPPCKRERGNEAWTWGQKCKG